MDAIFAREFSDLQDEFENEQASDNSPHSLEIAQVRKASHSITSILVFLSTKSFQVTTGADYSKCILGIQRKVTKRKGVLKMLDWNLA